MATVLHWISPDAGNLGARTGTVMASIAQRVKRIGVQVLEPT